MEATLQTSYQCPYGAEECPKVEETEDGLKEIKNDIGKLTRAVYVIIGFLGVEMIGALI